MVRQDPSGVAVDGGVESVGEQDDVELVPGGASDDTGEAQGSDGDAADWIFTLDEVHTLDVQLSLDALQALADDPYTYVEGAITFDEHAVDQVGVRLKGASGSFQPISSKANFKIDMNRVVEGQEFFGLEQLTVNNNVVDCSFLRETMGYRAFAAAGMPRTRTAYVWVTVNGNDKGLYTLLETPDDAWLDRVYSDGNGNLYDGKYVFAEDWSWFSRVDFLISTEIYFELEEGTEVGLEDIHGITQALIDHWDDPDGYAALGALLDWDSFHTQFATEVWSGHLDGYYTNNNNFRIYFNPTTGLAEILPWDMDYAFYEASDWGMSWLSPLGVVGQFCIENEACWAAQLERADEVFDIIDAAALGQDLEQAVTLITPYASADPYACGSAVTIAAYQEVLRTWVVSRSPTARARLGL